MNLRRTFSSPGYAKTIQDAANFGERLPTAIDEPFDDESASEHGNTTSGTKYLRIFSESDEEKVGIFCEYGINRKFRTRLVSDNEVELHIEIPIPPDPLVLRAGFHALQGPRLAGLSEDFYFPSPSGRRFAVDQEEENKKPKYYPNASFPQWVYFVFALEHLREELVVETTVDFMQNLESLQAQAAANQLGPQESGGQ